MNIFLTQFWPVKLLIHKPQPRHKKRLKERIMVILRKQWQSKIQSQEKLENLESIAEVAEPGHP